MTVKLSRPIKRTSAVLAACLLAIASVVAYRYFHFQRGDWKSVLITLDRTSCFGACPSYRIEVHGDGTVLYSGRYFVTISGDHRGKISPAALRELIEAFRSSHYLLLRSKYVAGLTDGPTYSTSITLDGFHKSVVDYMGERAWPPMPSKVSKLEETIDRLVGTEKWVCGSADTVSSLREEGWDFKSQDIAHASVLARVAACGDAHAVHDLVAAGAPVESFDDLSQSSALMHAARRGNSEMVRVLLDAGAGLNDKAEMGMALGLAAQTGKLDIVQMLLRSGANPTYADADGITILMRSTRSGVPAIVAQILKYQPDVNAHDHEGMTALMNLDRDKISGHYDLRPGESRDEVARLLLRAGANVNARDHKGNTPLMETPWNAAAARILIENGADVNARNIDGWTPLTHASGSEVVRLLLKYGADPFARDEKGVSELENQRNYSQENARLVEAAQAGKIDRTILKP